jgi:hypothetical protein
VETLLFLLSRPVSVHGADFVRLNFIKLFRSSFISVVNVACFDVEGSLLLGNLRLFELVRFRPCSELLNRRLV